MLGAAQVLSFTTLIMMFFGAIAGIIAAAIPGFTVTMAIVLTLPLAECSMKARTGGPVDDPEDLDEPAWAGLIPIGVAVGAPIPDLGAADDPVPGHVAFWARGPGQLNGRPPPAGETT